MNFKKETDLTQPKELHLKVLLAQLNAKFRDIDFNIQKIQKSLELYTEADKIDVILFPEMALSGYTFEDHQDVKTVAENSGGGRVFSFCSALAKRISTYVICGYAEIYQENGVDNFYNSLYVVDRDGNLYHNYRKHFLFEADYKWAQAGEKFETIKLKNTEGKEFKAALAICMDINPKDFIDPTDFSLADFCKKEEIDALFFSCAWLNQDPQNDSKDAVKECINYWIYRLYKLFDDGKDKSRLKKKWAFFCSNRVGSDPGAIFNGCSCALKANPVELVGTLDRKQEAYLLADITL